MMVFLNIKMSIIIYYIYIMMKSISLFNVFVLYKSINH